MEIASTLINVFVVVVMGAFVTYMTRDRYRELKADIARLETRMDAGFETVRSEFTAVRAEFRSEFTAVRSEFRSEFASVHADLTAVALAVRGEAASPPRETRQR